MGTTTKQNVLEQTISIPLDANTALTGELMVPEQARGMVVFAHGSSSRLTTRNHYIAHVLRLAGFATLKIDLLTVQEEAIGVRTMEFLEDIELLTSRLIRVTDWLTHHPDTAHFKIGYFGDGMAGGAAMVAAAERPMTIGAVVLRNGRPDRAGSALSYVQAPTLLIVGGNHPAIADLNQRALAHIHAEKRLEIIPGAVHLFEEPGTSEQVANLASEWLQRHLNAPIPPPGIADC